MHRDDENRLKNVRYEMSDSNPFALSAVRNPGARLAKNWLLVGVTALALSGLIALLLVIGRTTELLTIKDVFHVALVVHVDLSVLVWFLAISGMLWQLGNPGNKIPFFRPASLVCFAGGALCMALSPFAGEGPVYFSNYIPILQNLTFILGLSLVFAGTVIAILAMQLPWWRVAPDGKLNTHVQAQRIGIDSSAIIIIAALIAFVASYAELPPEIIEEQRYELLFWGGGHILQFAYTQIAMIAWLWMAGALGAVPGISPVWLGRLYMLGPVLCGLGLGAYVEYDVTDAGHREWFTSLMRYGNGIAPGIIGILILARLLRTRTEKWQRAYASSLWMSLLMFIVGGALGWMIQGIDTTTPAHYHGSIVGLTIAFMGLAYLLLPEFGYAPVAHTRLAFWQPIIYGVGQLMHVGGLAWAGGYGVMRKTPGVIEGGLSAATTAKYLIQWGGVFAILGGVLFVVVVVRSMLQARKKQA